MTHDDIPANDVVDRYVRRDLPAADAAAFEEHFFACDECFAAVEAADRLGKGVRHAADAGWLESNAATRERSLVWRWMPLAASVVFAAAAGWSWLVTIPRLESRAAASRMADTLAPAPVAPPSEAPAVSANVPVAIIAAERDVAAPQTLAVPAGASQIILWIDAPATPAAEGARLEILATDGRRVATVPGLVRNGAGAYVTGVPATLLPTSAYRLRLFASGAAGAALLGEYVLDVTAGR